MLRAFIKSPGTTGVYPTAVRIPTIRHICALGERLLRLVRAGAGKNMTCGEHRDNPPTDHTLDRLVRLSGFQNA